MIICTQFQVGTVNPVEDFKAMVGRKDDVQQGMCISWIIVIGSPIIIDREVRELMHLVASVCLSVHLFALAHLNRLTYDLHLLTLARMAM